MVRNATVKWKVVDWWVCLAEGGGVWGKTLA